MNRWFLPAIVPPSVWGLVLAVAGVSSPAWAQRVRSVAECEALVRREPRSLDGYECLLPHRFTQRDEVLRVLESRLRRDPEDPRPRLYRAILHHLAGDAADEREYDLAAKGFVREHDVIGEVYALTSHVSARCVYPATCDEQARALLGRAGELARASGELVLLQRWEIWRMKVALVTESLVAAEASESRLMALGEPASAFLKLESLELRAHFAARVRDYHRARVLSREMVDSLAPGDPRRALALGGVASATVHLALQGIESRENAERLVREALELQERAGLALWYPQIGYLPARIQLALLLGPTPESFLLLRSALAGYRARAGWTNPVWAELSLAELLATADPPQLEEALRVSEEAIEDASDDDLGSLGGLVLRSRIRFRLGQSSVARAEGLAALDLAEQLREGESEIPMRLRYAESLSFAYRSLAGDLAASRAPDDVSALDEAFQVMERLRARGLMETLLAEERNGSVRPASASVRPPTLAQIQAELDPREALLSFQVWRPEPTMAAPFREGSSWLTLVTSDGARLFRVPNADVLEPQVRAWTGLLVRRDGSDRAAGARLYDELLGPALAVLPPSVERLVIVPDGPLHRLPFDALSAGRGTPYLAERFGVSISPSASLWLRFRAAPRLPPGKVLVLADPADPSARRAVRGDATEVMGALVNARHEAEVALSAFPAGSELRTGPPASEAFLKSASLDGFSLLHLATHAIADERDPEHAAVVLAPGGPAEDGRLEPREIARLPLGGRTVVLAGCETSAGPVFRGEGVMSLARAFFSAGATAVVGTLDRARDDDAGLFFASMYRALGRGVTIGEAVVAAKRERIQEGAPPAAWAGVVLLGDAQARPRAREAPATVPLVLTGVVLAFAGLGAGRWLRRQRGG